MLVLRSHTASGGPCSPAKPTDFPGSLGCGTRVITGTGDSVIDEIAGPSLSEIFAVPSSHFARARPTISSHTGVMHERAQERRIEVARALAAKPRLYWTLQKQPLNLTFADGSPRPSLSFGMVLESRFRRPHLPKTGRPDTA